jgi:hypothetical protein
MEPRITIIEDHLREKNCPWCHGDGIVSVPCKECNTNTNAVMGFRPHCACTTCIKEKAALQLSKVDKFLDKSIFNDR